MKKSKMSAATLAEAESHGHVYDDGRILLRATGELVSLAEIRRRVRASNKSVRYADSHDGGSDESWQNGNQ